MIRGCGRRVKGGIYLEVRSAPGGRPLEDFLVDPPRRLPFGEQMALGIRPIGVTLLQAKNGVYHVVDWVGSKHYPNVADFLEEGRRFGFSRRVPRTLDFSRLSAESRLLIVHAKGWIDRWDAYLAARPAPALCRRQLQQHQPPEGPREMCVSLWWEDVVDGEHEPGGDPRLVRRAMPSFSYTGLRPPDGVETTYTPAFCAALPLGRIVVVRDPEGGTHQEAAERARRAQLPVEEVDE